MFIWLTLFDYEFIFLCFYFYCFVDVAKASDIGKKIINSGCDLNSTHSYLACYLLQEKYNPTSFWIPYLRILPQHYRNMPIFFEDEELKLLEGSFSIRKIIDRQEELKEEYENICKHVPEFRKYT
jgi:histone-lysine N-methyltransferase SETD3